MLMRLLGAAVLCRTKRHRVSVRVLVADVSMGLGVVDQLTMLDAFRMLDQEHVAARRALHKQAQHA
jgi:hypothetical protein